MARSHRFSILAFLVTSLMFALGCQAIFRQATPSPVPTSTSTPGIPTETPAPTQEAELPPSKGWIAFVKDGDLWLIHPDGSGAQQMTHAEPAGASDLGYETIRWSREGDMLAYSRNANIYILDILSKVETLKVEDVAGGLDWTLTGRRIVYDSHIWPGGGIGSEANDGLWIILVNARSVRRALPVPHGARLLQRPDMADDDRYGFAWGACGDIPGSCPLFIWNVERGGAERFPIDRISACAWAPYELKMACTRDFLAQGETSEVIVTDVYGDFLERIPASASLEHKNILWSRDGRTLAVGYFDRTGGGATDLISLENNERRLFAKGLPLGWSPDSQWLLIAEDGYSSASKLSIVNVNTGAVYFLTNAEGYNAVWQPEVSR